jgi:hypothetical protein
MVKSLSTLASDVGELKTSVRWMAWAIGAALSLAVISGTVIGLIAALKK